MTRLMRHEVRAKDNIGNWCCGFLRYDYKSDKYFVYNQNGDWEVSKHTICRNTGFSTRVESVTYNPIYEYDIVQLEWRGGKKEWFLMYYCAEMNCLSAMRLEQVTNKVSYYSGTRCDMLNMDDFSFMMQDPWGDIRAVSVVGNIFDKALLIEGNSGDRLI